MLRIEWVPFRGQCKTNADKCNYKRWSDRERERAEKRKREKVTRRCKEKERASELRLNACNAR